MAGHFHIERGVAGREIDVSPNSDMPNRGKVCLAPPDELEPIEIHIEVDDREQ